MTMRLTMPEALRGRMEYDPIFRNLDGVAGDDCRRRAAYYAAQARRDLERKRHLLGMAQSWLRLAVRADRIQALSQRTKSVIPRNHSYDTRECDPDRLFRSVG